MIRGLVTMLLTLALAGCSSGMTDSFTFMQTPDKPVARDVFPANFKQEIVGTIPSVVTDQRGIREAYYSDPVLDPKVNTYASCVRFNARDSAGQYQGAKEYVAYYYDGRLNQFVAATSPDQCRTANYKPFLELEKLCPGGKC